jgi:hypothetical protein
MVGTCFLGNSPIDRGTDKNATFYSNQCSLCLHFVPLLLGLLLVAPDRGSSQERLTIKWRDSVYVPVPGPSSATGSARPR